MPVFDNYRLLKFGLGLGVGYSESVVRINLCEKYKLNLGGEYGKFSIECVSKKFAGEESYKKFFQSSISL